MSDFRSFAESIRADLFGSPDKAQEHTEKQAKLAEQAKAADAANRRQGARGRIVAAGIPDHVMRVVRELQERCTEDFGFELADPIPQAMRAFTDGPTWLAVLKGPVGEGKSVAAGYALTQALELGQQGLWRTGVQLARELGSWDKRDTELRHKAESVDALVIDDLGMESARDTRAAPLIAGLILSRYEARRPTIITTNIARPEDLRVRYGAQFFDRLRGRHGLVYQCAGRDYRGKKTSENGCPLTIP